MKIKDKISPFRRDFLCFAWQFLRHEICQNKDVKPLINIMLIL
ncbi:hypothetical protein HMPREF0204_12040 [Chryseobacterium gleum ATCC 35910]|uniref:Uncharacterized protein n=1 Tax=Chryseobacterium gleum ATCC 35910 TaxID=525257 RepID=A0ABN0AIX1_CHRGE|nr:hypothetical protein HMPREF0204_12040 [Chryseobacterium gleum ATCC 35910]